MADLLTNDSVHFREVWRDNLEDEFKMIRDILDYYPYVSMDTEYPGKLVSTTREDREYDIMKVNVKDTILIQVGLTFSDENGNLPTCGTGKYCVWQFNFCEFVPERDKCNRDSIELLRRSGIDFKKNNRNGVSSSDFAALLMSSGAVLNNEVLWITFHGSYDFAYLLKLLSGKNELPKKEDDFFNIIRVYFPKFYDIKCLLRRQGLHGGLSRISSNLGVNRIGTSHQAGSDSLLTCCTYMKFIDRNRRLPREQQVSLSLALGVLYGLGDESFYR
ncbi:probable CCR4-associated factor 1 homolog 6 [Cannabis sativa]|uniref:probable CCR4-associated factor 1 homolog 6 n=1 Tax=Cannabis sativa TaxID=3483 RepID=UPI0029CA7CCD|nr:probable CCR4-associated factor 1 homolog 6 [Cannabis sativa]